MCLIVRIYYLDLELPNFHIKTLITASSQDLFTSLDMAGCLTPTSPHNRMVLWNYAVDLLCTIYYHHISTSWHSHTNINKTEAWFSSEHGEISNAVS